MIKLDYSLKTPEERNELVKKILEDNPEPSEKYLEILADYLILCMEKEERKERKILTDNRLTTVNKRECSFEGLAAQFENGEDGIYNLMSDNKQTIFQPKKTITKKDIEEIPALKQQIEAIKHVEEILKQASGKDAYILKKALIEMRKWQYVIKDAYRQPIQLKQTPQSKFWINLEEKISFDDDNFPIANGVSLLDSEVCSAILCNYAKLKQESYDKFQGDLYYLMLAFDDVSSIALSNHPLYEQLVTYKIDGLQNVEIQQKLEEEFGIKHSLEYISSLWRNKIPKLIASAAEDQYLDWYYLNVEKGAYKRCSRCGQIKLAHNKYFSKNKTSKDGFYSICKNCRNAKTKTK